MRRYSCSDETPYWKKKPKTYAQYVEEEKRRKLSNLLVERKGS